MERLLETTPTVYPHLNDFSWKLSFRYLSRPTQLRISKPNEEHSRESPEFPDQNLRQIGPGVSELWSVKQTDRQTAAWAEPEQHVIYMHLLEHVIYMHIRTRTCDFLCIYSNMWFKCIYSNRQSGLQMEKMNDLKSFERI